MQDVSKTITNEDLVNSIASFKRDRSAISEIVLIEEIEKARFIAPILMEGATEIGEAQEGTKIRFSMLTNTANESFFMVYTAQEELSKWSTDEVETIVLTYEELKRMVIDAELKQITEGTEKIRGFVINHLGDGLEITSDLMKYFDQKKTNTQKTQKNGLVDGTTLMFGKPAIYPTEMVKALDKLLRKHTEVESAYITLIHKDKVEKPNLLLIIDFVGDAEVLFPVIAEVLKLHLNDGESMDVAPANIQFAADIIKETEPFYKKEV